MSGDNKKRIVILDCCGERFSKIIDDWLEAPAVEEKTYLSLFPGQGWDVYVENILPSKSSGNPYSLDVVFTVSGDEDLFDCLCECLGDEKGWFEEARACLSLRQG